MARLLLDNAASDRFAPCHNDDNKQYCRKIIQIRDILRKHPETKIHETDTRSKQEIKNQFSVKRCQSAVLLSWKDHDEYAGYVHYSIILCRCLLIFAESMEYTADIRQECGQYPQNELCFNSSLAFWKYMPGQHRIIAKRGKLNKDVGISDWKWCPGVWARCPYPSFSHAISIPEFISRQRLSRHCRESLSSSAVQFK